MAIRGFARRSGPVALRPIAGKGADHPAREWQRPGRAGPLP